MAIGAPPEWISDAVAAQRLKLIKQVEAMNHELGLSSTIPGSEKEARLIFYRDAQQARIDEGFAFLTHYFSL